MRGTDPDAALYWLAKMIYAGEDPRFIARRILICASEDVGNADPRALEIATAAFNPDVSPVPFLLQYLPRVLVDSLRPPYDFLPFWYPSWCTPECFHRLQ